MGKSPSIADLAKRETEYRNYLNQITTELETKAQKYDDEMQRKINDYYSEKNWTGIDFVSGKNTDFMQKSEWSLKNVKLMIDSIAKAIFGDTSGPQGVTIEKSEELGKAIGKMENLQLYIAGKAFEVLSGIVESFGSAASVSFNSSYKSIPLGRGFHLFATVVCDSYKSQSFFKNEQIYQYLYIYEIRFSIQEGENEVKIDTLKLYQDQAITYNDIISDLLKKLSVGDITTDQYREQNALFNEMRDETMKQIKELEIKKSLKAHESARALMAHKEARDFIS